MKSRFLDANSLKMHVLEEGSGPLVLLAHGFPETSRSWRHQVSALSAAGFHAVAPDMRGYGQTEAPSNSERYSIFDLVGDLVGILDALGEREAIVVGNDWGSTVAWQAALLRPDRFRGVVALGVPMMGTPPAPPTQLFPQTDAELHYTLYFQTPGVAEAELERDVATTLQKILFAASRDAGPRLEGDGTPNPFGMVSRSEGLLAPLPLPPALPTWLPADEFRADVAAFEANGCSGGLNYYRNLDANWNMQRAFAGLKVQVPALFIVGEQDSGLAIPGMRQIISDMPSLVPMLRDTVFIPDCGHWAPQERPDEVSKSLIEFARSFS